METLNMLLFTFAALYTVKLLKDILEPNKTTK